LFYPHTQQKRGKKLSRVHKLKVTLDTSLRGVATSSRGGALLVDLVQEVVEAKEANRTAQLEGAGRGLVWTRVGTQRARVCSGCKQHGWTTNVVCAYASMWERYCERKNHYNMRDKRNVE
jgi:hypothetical protein